MFSLFLHNSYAVEYSVIGNDLTITGTGKISQSGVRSKGNYKELKTITIKEGPSEIQDDSFVHCMKLETISIPASVTTIGIAFARNNKLSNIIVSDSNPNYHTVNGALINKNSKLLIRAPTKPFTIPEGITGIAPYAFSCERRYTWETLVFPSTLTTFKREAMNEGSFGTVSFAPNSIITYLYSFTYASIDVLNIPTCVTEIKGGAFRSTSINTINFEPVSQVSIIDEGAFQKAGIHSIKLPDSVVSIKSDAFSQCTVLTSVEIGAGCTDINITAFTGCIKLSNFVISPDNSVYQSSNGAVMDKKGTSIIFIPQGYKSITIPSTVEAIGSTLLQLQEQLTEIKLDNNKRWVTEAGVLYSSNADTLIAVCGGVTKVSVKASVITIGESAAERCKKLTSVTFSTDTVCTTISPRAFYSTALKSFTLPNSVITIGKEAFSDCRSTTNFVINPESQLTTIGEYAFNFMKADIFIPATVTTVGFRAFADSSAKVTFAEGSKLKGFGSAAFIKSAHREISLPASVLSISDQCFYENNNLENVTFAPNSLLNSIAINAFYKCSALKTITLPSSCTSIGETSFGACSELTSIECPSLKNIGVMCFKDCVALKTFKIPSGVTNIEGNTFIGCTSLEEFGKYEPSNFQIQHGVVFDSTEKILYLFPPGRKEALISNTAEEIRANSFSGCSILKNLIFQSGCKMTEFGPSAFSGCVSLTSIIFPPFIETIRENCFENCRSLKSINLPSELKSIGTEAFIGCDSLNTVKYCGTNTITGEQNAFPETVNIYVTHYYTSDLLCSRNVDKKLGPDCEVEGFRVSQKSCSRAPNNLFLFVMFSIVI